MAEQNNKTPVNQELEEVVYTNLPDPEILAEYERIVPGTTKQLLRMAQAEQKHRHAWEDSYLIRQTKSYRTGQLFGFIAALVIIILASILAIMDRTEEATLVAIPGFFALIVTSILGYLPKKYGAPPRKK